MDLIGGTIVGMQLDPEHLPVFIIVEKDGKQYKIAPWISICDINKEESPEVGLNVEHYPPLQAILKTV
jgi:hypothetical protein